MHRLLPVILLAAACGQADSHKSPAAAPAAAAASAAPAPLPPDHAGQADLAREISEAERLGTWADVQHRWVNQTVRWNVIRYATLCNGAYDCNVAAFPVQRPAQQGWMPLLRFAPGQYDAMAKACEGRDRCEIAIEGTISELDISPDLPNKLALSNVKLVGAVQTAKR